MKSIVLGLLLLASGLEDIKGQLNFTCPFEWRKMWCANSYSNVTSCTYISSEFTIISAAVDKRRSDASCDYYEGQPDTYTGSRGVFGYYDNYIWTYKGCEARFNFCAVLRTTVIPPVELSTNELSISSSIIPAPDISNTSFTRSTVVYTETSSTSMISAVLSFGTVSITVSRSQNESLDTATDSKLLAGAIVGGTGALATGGALTSVILSKRVCNKVSPTSNNGDFV